MVNKKIKDSPFSQIVLVRLFSLQPELRTPRNEYQGPISHIEVGFSCFYKYDKAFSNVNKALSSFGRMFLKAAAVHNRIGL